MVVMSPDSSVSGGFASVTGTVIVSSREVTRGVDKVTDLIVHELAHVLGLWHVHHGISEMTCLDECLEKQASLGESFQSLSVRYVTVAS